MRILVVDDDEIALAVLRKVLRSDGHEVLLADNGEAAQEILQRNTIQLVISDWNMPTMSGIELCQYVRSTSSLGYIYFIIVTSRTGKEDTLAGLTAGADDFISKPFEPAELLARVRNAERIVMAQPISMTLFCLAKLAEEKDPDTKNHLERMRAYSKILASQLMFDETIRAQVPPGFPDLIYETSPLHDMGKVSIPDSILLKAGSLNDEEWLTMKQHTALGAEQLDEALALYPNAEFLRITRDIAGCHHERWDGTGYPNGLKGAEIPLSARIVALADVYDAITNKRSYKAARPHAVARGVILDGKGKHFDPVVVDAFLSTEDQFQDIKEKFEEE
jgi:putative two-component system response regulator